MRKIVDIIEMILLSPILLIIVIVGIISLIINDD